MSTTRMLTTEEFDYMKNYQSFIENRSQHQSMKRKLLKEIINLYGEKFYRLHEGTRKSLDRLCWFAAEKGFCFPGSTYLGKTYEKSKGTIDRHLKELRKQGQIITVYRRCPRNNGKGNPVHLFVNHPFFNHWVKYLQLDLESNVEADVKTENTENAWESKNKDTKKQSTYNLSLKDLNKYIRNDVNFKLSSDYVPFFIPKTFKDTVRPFFPCADDIYDLWGKVRLAYKASRLEKPLEDISFLPVQAFKETVFAYKRNRIKTNFAAYFFGTVRGIFVIERRKEVQRNGDSKLFYNFLDS
ncbi:MULTISPECIES: transcriptional regulator [Priestia]|nr:MULTISPECIES: transcriptional regulator [Priestia]UPK52897.1 helix-turn-helix domain-containing protein [Bacillus sp. H8-1]MCA1053050.1 helix-turn-helix domain-containing protein [Priestia aryabhattai]MDT0150365.1 transcriptional regulator [Priestia aryabhattai]MDT0155900.1 transcriptional regulator [Priestia aryabhattai]MED3821054.1 transcriptional regulator [Priestia aryabhattai]